MKQQASPSNTPNRPFKGPSEPLSISDPNVKGKQLESGFQPQEFKSQVNPDFTALPPTPSQPDHPTYSAQPDYPPSPDNQSLQRLEDIPQKAVFEGRFHIRTSEQATKYMLAEASQLHQVLPDRSEELCTAICQYINKISVKA